MECRFRHPQCRVGYCCSDCLRLIRNPHKPHSVATARRKKEQRESMAKQQLTKPSTTQTRTPDKVHPISPDLEGAFPNLFAFMTQDRWEDGTPRLTTTVLFFFERGELKCCVSDRDLQRSAFLTGGDFQSLLESVEATLEAGDTDWRQKRLAR